MKLITVILILTSIVLNELPVEILLCQDNDMIHVNLHLEAENAPLESEKDVEDKSETESEFDSFISAIYKFRVNSNLVKSSSNQGNNQLTSPYLELLNPPPEILN